MLQSFDHLAQSLFHKNSFDDLTIPELEQYASEYPYVAAARIMLARKLSQEGKPAAEAAATASLYIHNPLWLHWLLHPDQTFKQPDITVTTEDVVLKTEVEEELEPAPPPPASSIIEQTEEKSEIEQAEAVEHVPETPKAEIQPTSTETTIPMDKNPESKNESLVFEPYHTIDYFASQGIKLRPEDLEKDNFGRQLRSFTEWLRSMKKPGSQVNREVVDEVEQATVKVYAEHSVEGGDVATEAMADVWLKQGNPSRAIAIYEKLSLLNPSKSHYFAAKIEQLKNSGL